MENAQKQQKDNNKGQKNHRILTIVLIVIIILLLLGGIVPLLVAFISNQGVSQDVELIRNLNTALKLDKKEHRNMTEALDTAENAGYIVSRINAQKTNNEILWDSKNDVFVYLNTEKKALEYVGDSVSEAAKLTLTRGSDQPYLWSICEKVPAYNFSMYWNGKESDIPATIHTGFDAGKTEITKPIHYVNTTGGAQNVVIRTNSYESVTTIEAPLDTVHHYGQARRVDIKSIAWDSYHEYGDVKLIKVASGHILINNESQIDGIHFEAKDSNNDGVNDQFEKIIIEVADNTEIPTFYRDPVSIDPNGTLVCEIKQNSDSEFVWLAKQGVYEQIQVSDTEEGEKTWVSTSDATGLTKKVSNDIANILDYGAEINQETRDIVVEEGEKAEDYVTDKGQSSEDTEIIIDAETKVQAIVSNRPVTGEDVFDLYVNAIYADKALADKAYTFKAYSDAESVYVDAFLNASENGKPVFTNHIEDYSNQEKINKALAILETEKGEEARRVVEDLLNDKLPYINYLVDFEVSFDKDIKAGSVALGGYYAAFSENFYNGNWIGFGVSDFDENNNPIDLKANKPMRLMETAYQFTGNPDFRMNYGAILGYVKVFDCGYANLSDENEGTVLTVTLKIYETDENGTKTGKQIECGTYTETLGKVSEANKSLKTR